MSQSDMPDAARNTPDADEPEDDEGDEAHREDDELIDEQGRESFPASDPPAH